MAVVSKLYISEPTTNEPENIVGIYTPPLFISDTSNSGGIIGDGDIIGAVDVSEISYMDITGLATVDAIDEDIAVIVSFMTVVLCKISVAAAAVTVNDLLTPIDSAASNDNPDVFSLVSSTAILRTICCWAVWVALIILIINPLVIEDIFYPTIKSTNC
jgi:hypothetical protein